MTIIHIHLMRPCVSSHSKVSKMVCAASGFESIGFRSNVAVVRE